MCILLLSCSSVYVSDASYTHKLFDNWSAGLAERSRGFYHNNPPGGSNESISGEDGPAGMTTQQK